MVGRSLSARIEELERKLIEPPLPVCGSCGTVGGTCITEVTHHLDGSVSYDPAEPCGECEAITARLGRPSRIEICEIYARGGVGQICEVCDQESLATVRCKLAAGEMTTSEMPPMIEVRSRRFIRGGS